MMKTSVRWMRVMCFLAVAWGGFIGASAQAHAQEWPSRPITFVLSHPPGSSPDILARMLGEHIAKELGQPIIVENRGGGENVIGAMHAKRAQPDGYTYYLGTTGAMSINPHTLKDLPYDPLRDFEPVAMIGLSPFVIVSRSSLPAKTFGELIELSKKSPTGLNFATVGQHSFSSMVAESLNRSTGLKFVNISFNGAASAVQSLLGGHTDFTVNSIPPVRQFINQGPLRALAVTTSERQPELKDVPAVAETVPGTDYAAWYALFAPARTPKEAAERMNKAVGKALAVPSIVERLNGMGIVTREAESIDSLRLYVRKDYEMWKQAIAEIGVKPQ